MTQKQVISIPEIRKQLPARARLEVQRKKGSTGRPYLEIGVKMVPNLSEKEHYELMNYLVKFFGEDLIELYTEETGFHFYIYLRMSTTQPTEVIV